MRSHSTETGSGLGGGSFSFQQKPKQKAPIFRAAKQKQLRREMCAPDVPLRSKPETIKYNSQPSFARLFIKGIKC